MVRLGKAAKRFPTVVSRSDEVFRFPWLESALLLCGVSLFLQCFPSVWFGFLSFAGVAFSYFNPRQWSWRSYAVVFAVAIVALFILKSRQSD